MFGKVNTITCAATMGVIMPWLLLVSCSKGHGDLLAQSLRDAGDNSPEIEKVLSHYGDERAEIAEWLVCAIPGLYSSEGEGMDSVEALYRRLPHDGSWYLNEEEVEIGRRFASMPVRRVPDLRTVSADYLISNIDDAYSLWKSREWNKGLSMEQFCELLLPYRVGDERLTEWRGPYRERMQSIEDTLCRLTNSVDAARVVSGFMGYNLFNDQLTTPLRSALDLLDLPLGYCREDCARTMFEMRAMGIPVCTDMMPVSPDNGTSHQWSMVYDTDDGIYRMFGNDDYLPTRDSIHWDKRRKGKVYRQTTAIQLDRLRRYEGAEDAPAFLLNPRLKDVTAEYFGHNEATVRVDASENDVYLSLFTPGGLRPVDIGESEGGKGTFTDMEPEVIFFPAKGVGGGYRQCGLPFMLTRDGETHVFEPDTTSPHTVTLTRKMPVRFILSDRVATIAGCRIETSETSTGPWRELHTIVSPGAEYSYRVPLNGMTVGKYIRLVPRPGESATYMAEVIASSDSLGQKRIPMKSADARHDAVTDGDILTWVILGDDETVVMRVESDEPVRYLSVSSYNDDNYVVPGEEYELQYFTADGVRSLGRKVAKGYSIEFEAPENAVFRLRNHTKGREEQVFIYRDRRQLFNIDLDTSAGNPKQFAL